MTRLRNSITLSLFIISTFLFSQTYDRFDVPVLVNGNPLENPWTGGLNAPQYSDADFNNDGLLDLFVFDRVGDVPMVFLNEGIAGEISYKFAPEYLDGLPQFTSWVLLRDYNKDGIMDIFCYPINSPSNGVEAYKGYFEDNKLKFELVKFPSFIFDILSFTTLSGQELNLYVSKIDIPAVDDLDNDGDLDVLTFNQNGGKVEYYKNVSVEKGYETDTLLFVLEDSCWGGIYESGDQPALELSPIEGECARRLSGFVTPRHRGSTLLTFDLDNDCDKELLLGDLSFDHMVLAINGGDCEKSWVNKQDTFFPSENLPINLPSYPAAFHLDVNNDGKRDLIAAKNLKNGGEDIKTSWLYLNTGTDELPEFSVQQTNFYTDQMLDFGSGSNPAFVDYNTDGLIDLVVGSEGEFDRLAGANSISKLVLFENIGTRQNPIFELKDDNWQDLKRFSKVGGGTDFGFSPTFHDFNGDGHIDLLLGSLAGGFYYFENKGLAGTMELLSPIIKFGDIDVGRFSSIEMYDLDGDGIQDLIIGEQNAGLNFLKNIGTNENPQFDADENMSPNSNSLGKIDLREGGFSTGFGTPVILYSNAGNQIITGNEFGTIQMFDLNTDLTAEWTKREGNLGNTSNGVRIVPDFADLDGDGFYEMVVGNLRGGLCLYKTDLQIVPVSTNNLSEFFDVKISPNPANEKFQINSNVKGNWKFFDVKGRLMASGNHDGNVSNISTRAFSEGIYFINLISEKGSSFSHKILVQH